MDPIENKNVQREFGISSGAVNNRTSIIILTFLIAMAGVMAYNIMPKESFPEIKQPMVYINTFYPGNSPEDMENLITRPIEKELKSMDGIKKITSTSIENYSIITAEFNTTVEITKALQETKDAVDRSKTELPNDLDQDPVVQEFDISNFPIMYLNVSGDYGIDELKAFAEYLEEEIEKLPEISGVDIKGALEREIRINVDQYRMESKQVSFNDIANAVAAENLSMSGGNLLMGDYRRSLSIRAELEKVSDLNNIIVKNEDGNIVYLNDVATVEDTYEERESFARESGDPVVTLDVTKRSGENLLDASDKIKEIIKEAKQNRFPEDLRITINNDQSKQTRSQVENLENSIIFGVILVVLVLMFFMGLRNALFVGIAIPLSMFLAFIILNLAGVTLNMMVLFALILALGMLVDNGIVVVENIYRLKQMGYSNIRAAKEGVGEVAWPIITSTATTLAAFMPLAFWGGLIGEFMKFLPITLIIVLFSSLFVGLVINPVVSAIFMKLPEDEARKKSKALKWAIGFAIVAIILYIAGKLAPANLLMLLAILIPINLYFLDPATEWFQNRFLVFLEDVYYRTVRFALSGWRPYLFFAGTVALMFFSIVVYFMRQPKVDFFPVNEPQYVNVFIEQPLGTDIETTNAFTERIEKRVMGVIEPYQYMVESVVAQVGAGTSDPGAGPQGGVTPHKARITVAFQDFQERRGKSTGDIMEEIRNELQGIPGAVITVEKNRNGPPVGKPIDLQISGEDYEKLIEVADMVIATIENSNIQGYEALKTDLEIGRPELVAHVDREKARRYGLSTQQIGTELRNALFGYEVSKFKDGEDEYPIQLRLEDRYRYDIESLMNKRITFRNNKGQMRQIPISAVATVEYSSSYGSIKRKDLKRVISVYSNVKEDYNANEIVQDIQQLVAEMDVPQGYEVRIGGEQEEQAKSMAFLSRALMIAVFAIFLIIVAQFNSVVTPFIIMCSVLFSTIGVFLGLVIFNMNFVVIMTGIGIISLAGVVVNNAIVLIDYTNLIRARRRQELGIPEEGRLPYKEIVDSIIEGGKTRLRPVLLTAITTVLGLIPLATGMNINFFSLFSRFDPDFYVGGDNAIFWGPMAWTVIFGLTFATFLTLVIVPVMYLIADKISYKLSKV
ncbi:efflux RND transporter permease subunit [Cesiribacter andamanensis]|uniref:Multidrug transporter MdtC n=1 Tax=Cesiribacter andamanensis AMV16 TaxID=1279009 RepID=M7N6F3_9BACT|nr:efflux RND transporter permease subunit [Cesiribacter andamanensis]EMR02791.1 Multidrug transporter MdtC [Cesiribacter andamanensis AMV16]